MNYMDEMRERQREADKRLRRIVWTTMAVLLVSAWAMIFATFIF